MPSSAPRPPSSRWPGWTRRWLARLLLSGLALQGGCGSAGSSAAARPLAEAHFSPYADVSLNYDWTGAARSSGTRHYTLAFVVGGGCRPGFGAGVPLGAERERVRRLRDSGGDVALSFGGRDGPDLARSCRAPGSLAAAYRSAQSAYRATELDFDIEGPALSDATARDRRSAAMAALQASPLSGLPAPAITLTLPATPSGLTTESLSVVRSALAHGVRLRAVNLMAMDYGDADAPRPRGRMGAYAIAATTGAERQLGGLLPGRPAAELWRTLAVTLMVGVNDVRGEAVSRSDARAVLAFARQRHLALLSIWSAARDRPCRHSTGAAQPTCSGVAEPPLSFTRLLSAYRG